MKNLGKTIGFLALFALLFSATVNAAPGNYIEGAVLRVVAKSGLKLRAEPSLNARVFTTMDFGEEVTVLNTENFIRTQTIELVTGNWVYVEYRGFKGYAFDGFLSDLPLPTGNFDLFELIELTYDVIENKDSVMTGFDQEEKLRIYENGFEVRNVFGEGGSFTELRLPDTRLGEAYVLCMNTIPSFEEFMKTIRVKRDAERNIIEYKGKDEFTEIQIRKDGEDVVVSMFSGC